MFSFSMSFCCDDIMYFSWYQFKSYVIYWFIHLTAIMEFSLPGCAVQYWRYCFPTWKLFISVFLRFCEHVQVFWRFPNSCRKIFVTVSFTSERNMHFFQFFELWLKCWTTSFKQIIVTDLIMNVVFARVFSNMMSLIPGRSACWVLNPGSLIDHFRWDILSHIFL